MSDSTISAASTITCGNISNGGGDCVCVPLKIYEKLISELRCPGCSTPMKYAILLCNTGHSICENCTKMLEFCPLCKEEFTSTRNLTLEALCSKAEFPCENSISGCRARLTLTLLDWHEKQCTFRTVRCFIGKVWGKCDWKGLEKHWLEHINKTHLDKVYGVNPTELQCYIKNGTGENLKPLTAYYIFQMYNQVFSFYQIYDKINKRILWTMSYEPSKNNKYQQQQHQNQSINGGDYYHSKSNITLQINFAFEIEIYDVNDSSKSIIQRYECHRHSDDDILRDGACAVISMGDALRFIDDKKILHYRVRIHKISCPKNKIHNTKEESPTKYFPIDYQQVSIQGVNHKQVSPKMIITRKTLSDDDEKILPSNSELLQNASADLKSPRNESTFDSNDSESDEELEEFVNQLFKRRYLVNFGKHSGDTSSLENQQNNIDMKSSSYSSPTHSSNPDESRKHKIIHSLSKSYKEIKENVVDLKRLSIRKKIS